jgi:aldehyde:ferredoxin oxidoreductase
MGQGMAAYEPRGIKGLGVTYMTSAMGADHTTGATHKMDLDHHKAEGQVEASIMAQTSSAIYDCLGLCMFVSGGIGSKFQIVADLVNAIYGETWNVNDLINMAKENIKREQLFNAKAGIKKINRLPEYMYFDKNRSTETVFDITESEIEKKIDKI